MRRRRTPAAARGPLRLPRGGRDRRLHDVRRGASLGLLSLAEVHRGVAEFEAPPGR